MLAQNRAIATAFLVAGDDDLREGVVMAQEYGVHVSLWGVGANDNIARTLTEEADRVARLHELEPFFTQDIATSPPASITTSVGRVASADARENGRDFAQRWLHGATEDDLAELLRGKPAIPRTLDSELLRHAERVLGDLRGRGEDRQVLRAGFWTGIDEAVARRR